MKKFFSFQRDKYLLFQECSVNCVADAKLAKNDRMKKKSGLFNHGLTYVKGMAKATERSLSRTGGSDRGGR